MSVTARAHRRLLRLLTIAASAMLAVPTAAAADRDVQPVANWVRRNAVQLNSVDPAARLDDLEVLRDSVGAADVVGLGEAVHGTAEQLTLRHRALRFLVEEMGFRSVAWEEQWTTGVKIDEYIRTGVGDLDELVREMSPPWPYAEVRDVLLWLRDYNTAHAEQVRFVGVEYYLTWMPAYAAVEAYVAEVAPDRLPELEEHWAVIKPPASDEYDVWAHVGWYMSDGLDRAPYIDAAREMYALVDGIAHQHGDARHDLALHHARQIVSFYEHYDLPQEAQDVYRDARAAENLDWWRRRHPDQRVAYWAASAHTANAPTLHIATADRHMRFRSVGSYLRSWYGDDYVSIGFTFDRGAAAGFQGAVALPPAEDGWFERPLRDVGYDQFLVDLRDPGTEPGPVRSWLHGPTRTRGLADGGATSYMDGGSLAQWFDVLVHRNEVTPAHDP